VILLYVCIGIAAYKGEFPTTTVRAGPIDGAVVPIVPIIPMVPIDIIDPIDPIDLIVPVNGL